jgi:hypothetical protein
MDAILLTEFRQDKQDYQDLLFSPIKKGKNPVDPVNPV